MFSASYAKCLATAQSADETTRRLTSPAISGTTASRRPLIWIRVNTSLEDANGAVVPIGICEVGRNNRDTCEVFSRHQFGRYVCEPLRANGCDAAEWLECRIEDLMPPDPVWTRTAEEGR